MPNLRVLHVYRTYFPDPPGGLQEAIRQIAVSSKDYGIEPRVFTLSPAPQPTEIEYPEARVIRERSLAAPASCDLGGINSFKKFSAQLEWADIVHYHFPWPFADLLHLVTRPNMPSVMTYHSDIVRQRFLGQLYSPLMRHMLNKMAAIIATSPAYAKTSPVLSSENIQNRVRIIPLGIDERTYQKISDPNILDRLGLTVEEPFFLFIGVLRYYKGLHTLVQAASSVRAKIVIAGSGPEKIALVELLKAQGNTNVLFAGQVTESEKITLLKSCKALVLPSHLRSEAYGMVLIEAEIFGKPMITCEIGTGTSFVNAENETGFVVPPENPAQLAFAMNSFLDDKKLAHAFGRAARARYERMFSGKVLGQAYADLYRQVRSK